MEVIDIPTNVLDLFYVSTAKTVVAVAMLQRY